MALSWSGGPWVADTSAWARASSPEVSPSWKAAAHAGALIAAAAAERGFAVLHYDQHFDRLASVLGFASQWVAAEGSIS